MRVMDESCLISARFINNLPIHLPTALTRFAYLLTYLLARVTDRIFSLWLGFIDDIGQGPRPRRLRLRHRAPLGGRGMKGIRRVESCLGSVLLDLTRGVGRHTVFLFPTPPPSSPSRFP